MLSNYSLTRDQMSFLDFLVPLKQSSWNPFWPDYSVHSHSLVQYCLGQFPKYQQHLFRLWKHAIDTFMNQTSKKTTLLQEGCTAIQQGKEYLHNLLDMQSS